MILFKPQLLIGTGMVMFTVIFHIVCLIVMIAFLKRMMANSSPNGGVLRSMWMFVVAAMYILVVHIIGIWCWAILFLKLGAIAELEAALYYSTVTATTVGYGDVVLSPDWRILGSFEAMSGILLFGISTAFLIEVLKNCLKELDTS